MATAVKTNMEAVTCLCRRVEISIIKICNFLTVLKSINNGLPKREFFLMSVYFLSWWAVFWICCIKLGKLLRNQVSDPCRLEREWIYLFAEFRSPFSGITMGPSRTLSASGEIGNFWWFSDFFIVQLPWRLKDFKFMQKYLKWVIVDIELIIVSWPSKSTCTCLVWL